MHSYERVALPDGQIHPPPLAEQRFRSALDVVRRAEVDRTLGG